MKCSRHEESKCGDAYGMYTWGLYPKGEHNKDVPLCKTHADELWEQSKGLVSTGRMHFVIKPLEG